MVDSNYDEVIALKSMLSAAMSGCGQSWVVVDIAHPDPGLLSSPYLIIDSDEERSYNLNTINGSLTVLCYDNYDSSLSNADNAITLQNKLRVLVDTLWLLPMTTGYLTWPRYKLTPGAKVQDKSHQVTGCRKVIGVFTVQFGLQE